MAIATNKGTALKVTVENWKDIERKIRKAGIENAIYDSAGVLQTIVLKSGDRYEFTMEVIKQLQNAGLIVAKRGIRVEPNRG